MGRLTAPRLAIGLFAAVSGTAHGQDLCSRLTIPGSLGLTCSAGAVADAIVVEPTGGTFAALSRMTVRQLDRAGPDAAAWTDPSVWLRTQMAPDTSGLIGALGGLADDPDSPFGGSRTTAALDSLKRALAGISALALSACDQAVPTAPDRWELRCSYAADGIGLWVTQRLVAAGERRWLVTMRAANDQRLHHFEAIANSFQPS